MTTIQIIEQDRIDAENFLEQFLTDAVPTADFRKGGALRDLAVGAMGSIFAYLRKEVDYVKARQSLLLLGSLADADVDSAVDEILSNWFITRKVGLKSRGQATVFLSQAEDIFIPATARFTTASGLIFNVDSTTPIARSAAQLVPLYSNNGTIAYYSTQIPLISAGEGEAYNIEPQAFTSFTNFSVYLARVENASKFSGAAEPETTTEMLNRAETAISTRNMVSARSIDATLRDTFADVTSVKVIGYGDSEMTRDFVEEASTRTRIHTGGAADVFLNSPLTQGVTASLVVGDVYTDPRPGAYILRDDAQQALGVGNDFVSKLVARGDILRIYNTMEHEGAEYIIDNVTPLGVYVSRRSQFPNETPVAIKSFTDGIINGAATDYLESPVATYVFGNDDLGRYIRIKNPTTAAHTGIYQIRSIDTTNNRASLIDQSGVANFVIAGSPITWDLIERELLLGEDSGSMLFDFATTEFRLINLPSHTFTALDNGVFGRVVKIWGSAVAAFNDVFYISALGAGYVVLTSMSGATPPGADIPVTSDFDLQMFEQILADNFIERQGRTLVSYTIGDNSPDFDNKIDLAGKPRVNGRFTRELQEDGVVLLPQHPIYRIQSVSFVPRTTGTYGTLEVGGRVTFNYRSNTNPIDPAGDPQNLEYWVECLNPSESQSGWQVLKLHVGNAGSTFNGETLEVVYDTISGYDSVWSYMLSGDRRLVCGSVIPRGFHPVYITANIRYSISRNATEAIDEAVAAQAVVDYLVGLQPPYELDTSDLVSFLRTTYPNIGYIDLANLDIHYQLIAPDGRMIYYTTKDQVVIDPAKHRYPGTPLACLDDPLAVGISANTVRFLSVPGLITLTNVVL